jgi:hypothetical protein
MKPHGPIWVVRKWHGLHADLVLRCLDDLEGLNHRYMPSGCGLQVCELANNLRLGTVVPSQDLSGAWVTVQGSCPFDGALESASCWQPLVSPCSSLWLLWAALTQLAGFSLEP